MSSLGNKDIMALNIKYYMEKNGIDRNELCSDLGIKYTTLCDWLNAKTYPRIDKIEMMANYFGVQKSDLVESRSEKKQVESSPVENIMANKKPGVKIIRRDGTSQEFDINSVIYAVTESLMRMSPEEQKLVHKMVARDDDDNKGTDFYSKMSKTENGNKKKTVVYVSNPRYAKTNKVKKANNAPRLNAAHERTDVEVTDELKQHDDNFFDED